jgi:hypothetical protein
MLEKWLGAAPVSPLIADQPVGDRRGNAPLYKMFFILC